MYWRCLKSFGMQVRDRQIWFKKIERPLSQKYTYLGINAVPDKNLIQNKSIMAHSGLIGVCYLDLTSSIAITYLLKLWSV